MVHNSNSNYGDIDNDGIPNEFDVDYIEGKPVSHIKKDEEIKKDIADVIEEENEAAVVPELKKKKKLSETKKGQKGFKIKKRPAGLGFNIPDLPLELTIKRDMQLLATGKIRLKDIRKHFCNVHQIIVVNGKKMTLTRFNASVKGDKIKIKNFHIELESKGCVKQVILEYSVEPLFKPLRAKPRRLTKISKNIGF